MNEPTTLVGAYLNLIWAHVTIIWAHPVVPIVVGGALTFAVMCLYLKLLDRILPDPRRKK